MNSCSTSVQHNPSNVNSTSTTTPDSGLKSEPKLEHQKPKSEPRKKVQFSQEEVEDDTHDNLQPTSNTTSSNVQVRNVDYSYQKLNTRMFISKKYQSAMCELLGATADISKSLDHTVLSSACYVCDPRLKVLVHEVESLETNKQLSQNITFVPSDGFLPSHWRYDQLFNGKIDYLPSGEFEAKRRTRRLLDRLNRDDDAVPRCASEKLQELYCEKGLSWLTGFDKTNKIVYFPLTLALKDAGSTSSARVCSATNGIRKTEIGDLSFNDCCYDLALSQPSFQRFQVGHHFSAVSCCTDIKGMFSAIWYSYTSSLTDCFFCFKDVNGYPTLVTKDSVDGELHGIRNQRCSFGPKLHPAVSQYILKSTARVFKEHHELNHEESFLLSIVQNTLKYYAFADDVLHQIGRLQVLNFFELEENGTPLSAPSVNIDCLEQGICKNTAGHCWTTKSRQKYLTLFDAKAQQLLVKTAAFLLKILNHSNFFLKMYDSNVECLKKQLDSLITAQRPYTDPERKIQVTKPSKSSIGQHIDKLLKRQITHRIEAASDSCSGLVHLGHLVSAESISLKDQSISLKYLSQNGKQGRSKSFNSYEEFLTWNQQEKPFFTKRTCFSILCCNSDFSSSFLVLFQGYMKVVIREYLQQFPKAGWDSIVGDQTAEKLKLAIKLYFYFVQQKVPKLNFYQHANENLFIICYTDASKDLLTYTISTVSRTCIGGTVQSTATHLCCRAYTVHAEIHNVLHCEFLAILKCLSELGLYLVEIEKLGVCLPKDHRFLFTDSQIALHLLRRGTLGIKTKYRHLVSKIQLKLYELSICPLLQVAYVQQLETTHYADVISKFDNDYEKIITQHKRLWELSSLLKHHPKFIPGVYYDLCLPSKEETEFLQSFVCEKGESDRVLNEIKEQATSKIKPNLSILSMAARTYLEDRNHEGGLTGEGFDCSGDFPAAQCERELQEFLREGPISPQEEEGVGGRGSPEEQPQAEERSAANQSAKPECEVDTPSHEREPDSSSASGTSAPGSLAPTPTTSPRAFSPPPTTPLPPSQAASPPETAPLSGDLSANDSTQSVNPTWREQVNNLIMRKTSYGFGPRGVLAILVRTLQLLLDWREAAKLGAEGRLQRQEERRRLRQDCQTKQEQKVRLQESKSLLCKDIHDLPTKRVNLLNLSTGRFGHLIAAAAEKGEEVVHLPGPFYMNERDRLQTRIFHHLVYLNQDDEDWLRGTVILRDIFDQPIRVKEHRRLRSLDLTKVWRARSRPLAEDSALEGMVLWAAHRSTLGLNLEQALLCVASLQIDIKKVRDKLQKISKLCPACNQRRALCGRKDQLIKISERAPTDLIFKPLLFPQAKSTHIMDLMGPLWIYSGYEGGQQIKIFLLIVVELPLKLVRILPLQSYSTEDFLLCIETYRLQNLQSLEIIWSDLGSNFSRAQNRTTIHNQTDDEEQEERQCREALTQGLQPGGEIRGKMEQSGIFVSIAQGDHKSVAAVEQVVAVAKGILLSHLGDLHQPLTYFELNYLTALISSTIASRPICQGRSGQIYTPASLLSLMGRSAHPEDTKTLDFAKEGDEAVTKRIEDMEEKLVQTKLQLAQVILACFIEPAYNRELVRSETTKRHEEDVEVEIGDVLFCKRLYAKTLNFVQSLVRVRDIGVSHQVVLLQKVGGHRKKTFVTRSLDNLYFIAKNNQRLIGAKQWLPTFNLCEELKDLEVRRGYVTFTDVPVPIGWEAKTCGQEGEIGAEEEDFSPEPEVAEDHQGGVKEAGEPMKDFVTRGGRKTRAPVRYSE